MRALTQYPLGTISTCTLYLYFLNFLINQLNRTLIPITTTCAFAEKQLQDLIIALLAVMTALLLQSPPHNRTLALPISPSLSLSLHMTLSSSMTALSSLFLCNYTILYQSTLLHPINTARRSGTLDFRECKSRLLSSLSDIQLLQVHREREGGREVTACVCVFVCVCEMWFCI